MKIIGCDFHPSYQQIAMVDTETGELWEGRLEHEQGEARRFYHARMVERRRSHRVIRRVRVLVLAKAKALVKRKTPSLRLVRSAVWVCVLTWLNSSEKNDSLRLQLRQQ